MDHEGNRDVDISGRRILIVEDDPTHALLMRKRLREMGGRSTHAEGCGQALEYLRTSRYDAVILDVGLPDGDGFEIHDWIQQQPKSPPVVFVTSDDMVEHAVTAVQTGASDYVVKRPNYLEQMAQSIFKTIHRNPATQRSGPNLVGRSPALMEVKRRIREFADADAAVLITGETGTGKDVVARAIHEQSSRASRAFVVVNCAAIPSNLFEAEIFGHRRGAFTGAHEDRAGLLDTARGGTLFLDEIGELEPDSQAKLLRLLENRAYRAVGDSSEKIADVRVLAATNVDLTSPQSDFRRDLYYRLSMLQIHLKPLRERRGDIGELLQYFVREISSGTPPTISPDAIPPLIGLDWPGNVRELRHVVERTLLCSRHAHVIQSFDLGNLAEPIQSKFQPGGSRADLADLLARHQGRLGPVADEMNVSIRTVQRRMKDFGLNLREFRQYPR